MRNLRKTIGWRRIHYGQYEINRSGLIRRVTACNGTHPGRFLTPYYPAHNTDAYVKLCHGHHIRQVRVEVLVRRAFPS